MARKPHKPEEIVGKLRDRLIAMAGDEYIVIGHSLGGILLRSAVATLPAGVRRPRRIIMLATPNHSPRLARRFGAALWYRAINGDAGQWRLAAAVYVGANVKDDARG